MAKFEHQKSIRMEEKAQYYRHFKGGRYKLLYIAKDSEDPSCEMVVYQALYGDRSIWVRPKDMFFSDVERGGYKGSRFASMKSSRVIRRFLGVPFPHISAKRYVKREASNIQP